MFKKLFGYNDRKKEKKKLQASQQSLADEKAAWESEKPARQKETSDFQAQQVKDKAAASKAERQADRDEAMQWSKDLFSQPREGLNPKTKSAMQYEASNNINRAMQNANRQLLGQQGMNGITGKSGVAYAQQRDLQRVGQDAEGQATRDLDKLDSDLGLKNLAAQYAHAMGESSQGQLDKQKAKDELDLGDEKKWQKEMTDKINELFSRI